MPPAIVVENLGKSYRVSHEQVRGGYKTLRETLTSAAARPINRLRSLLTPHPSPLTNHSETFWALKDVSFEVQPGEVVGIIGRNGAGKSTLLKILSRITKPTTGRVTLNGRVGSLLEVGTGFHPELTGRENIFMNGSILGMSRREIQRKFDEIVDFSGVERFLDTPVKRYSSGMQVRLAFAVAAHLEPEIVIVDEVLAVGDVEFQKKCLGKMEDVAHSGRTVLFVSHNMAAVQSLCDRAVLLRNGEIAASGSSSDIVARYINAMLTGAKYATKGYVALKDHPNRKPSCSAVATDLSILDESGNRTTELPLGAPFSFELSFIASNHQRGLGCGIFICSLNGERLVAFHSRIHSRLELPLGSSGKLCCRVPVLPLLPGDYRVDIVVGTREDVFDCVEHAATISILPTDYLGTGELPNRRQGLVAMHCSWELLN